MPKHVKIHSSYSNVVFAKESHLQPLWFHAITNAPFAILLLSCAYKCPRGVGYTPYLKNFCGDGKQLQPLSLPVLNRFSYNLAFDFTRKKPA